MSESASHLDPGASRPPSGLRLLVLLWVAILPRQLDVILVPPVDAAITLGMGRFLLPLGVLAVQIASAAVVGFVIDRIGLRRCIGGALLAWAALVLAMGTVGNVALLAVLRVGSILAVSVSGIGLLAAVRLACPLRQRASALAILSVLIGVWMVGAPLARHLTGWPAATKAGAGFGIFLAGAGLGAAAAIFWWVSLRHERPLAAAIARPVRDIRSDTIAAMFRHPGVWSLVVVQAGHFVVFYTLYQTPVLLMREQRLSFAATVAIVAPAVLAFFVGQMAFARASDRRAARLGQAAAARWPFIVAGAGLSALVGLVPYVAHLKGVGPIVVGTLLTVVALGLAAYSLGTVLALDVVGRAFIGRFCGLAFAFAIAVFGLSFFVAGLLAGLFYARGLAMAYAMELAYPIAGTLALLAATLAAVRLRHVQPMEADPDREAAITRVFA